MRILHISDIQEGIYSIKEDLKKLDNFQEVYKSILDDLRVQFKSIHSEKPVDIIIISGDLASTGEEEEYNNLTNEFISMMKQVFLNGKLPVPISNWLISPGNHDVTLGNGSQRFNNFIKFCHDNGFHSNFKENDPSSIFDSISYFDKKTEKIIDLIVLNSCLDIYDKKSSKYANLPKEYYYKFENELNQNSCKIMICHHRLIEISANKTTHCLNELHNNNVFLALVGDFHESLSNINIVNGIRFLCGGALLAKKSERTSGIDESNREINIYDLDFGTGKFTQITYIKTRTNWTVIPRNDFYIPCIDNKNQENEGMLIQKLQEIKDIIHRYHPFKDIPVREMKRSFYEYLDQKQWKEARNQVTHKLEYESEILTEMIISLISINSFNDLKEDVADGKDVPLWQYGYSIPAKYIVKKYRKELPIYRNSLIRAIRKQLNDLKKIGEYYLSIFSNDGILLFIDSSQQIITEKYYNFMEGYKEDRFREVNIDELDDYNGDKLERIIIEICEQIDFDRLDEINNFLQEIYNYIIIKKNELEFLEPRKVIEE